MENIMKELTQVLSKAYETEAMAAFSEFFSGELHTLQYLSKHTESDVFPSDLSDALHVTRARITKTLAALRKKGYVKMDLCEKDRRRMRISLTDSGVEYLYAKQQVVRVYIKKWIDRLGTENTAELIRLLKISLEQ
jgi:DNA-binding MarR family transcriptional regulator